MLYILIRTCPRDDYIGRLAYESLMQFYPHATYVFLAEPGTYTYLVGTVVYRTPCDNFGGQAGAKALMEGFRRTSISPDPTDVIFLVDSDIVMLRDVWPEVQDVDHAGVYGITPKGLGHVSGQFQILSGAFFSHLKSVSQDTFHATLTEMLNRGLDIADDTMFSFISDSMGLRKRHIPDGWIHYKYFEHNGDTRYTDVIDTVRRNYSKVLRPSEQ
jgi:hypothetical protein